MRFKSSAALALIGGALAAVTATASATASATTTTTTTVAAPTATTTAPALRVLNAWIRWLPANLPAAGYATLENSGDATIVLTGVSSPGYGDVSIHRTVALGANTDMVPVDKLVIKPHSSVNFAGAGYHLMLMQPTAPLKPGDHVPITLRFGDGSSMRVEFEVRKPDAT